MPEKREPHTTIKFATAKAELKEIIETQIIGGRGTGGEVPDINSFSSNVIEDFVPPEFISEAEFWWNDTGTRLWKEEINKRYQLYFNPYAIGFLAGWVSTYISFIFFPHAAVTISVTFAIVTGAFYGICIKKMVTNRLYHRLRTTFLSSLIIWKVEKLVRKYPEFLFINLEDLSDTNFLRNIMDDKDFLTHFIKRK